MAQQPYVNVRTLQSVEQERRLPELADAVHTYAASKEGRRRLRHLGLIGLTERYASPSGAQEQVGRLARAVAKGSLEVGVVVDNQDAFVGMVTVQPDVHAYFVGILPAKLHRRFRDYYHMPGSNVSAWANTGCVDEFRALAAVYSQLPEGKQTTPAYWTLERADESDRMAALSVNDFQPIDSGRIDDQEFTMYPPVRTLMAR